MVHTLITKYIMSIARDQEVAREPEELKQLLEEFNVVDHSDGLSAIRVFYIIWHCLNIVFDFYQS